MGCNISAYMDMNDTRSSRNAGRAATRLRRSRTSGWWFVVLPALVCVPCLALPLFVAGATAIASAAGGLLGGLVIASIALLLGGTASIGAYLVVRRRAHRAAACGNVRVEALKHEGNRWPR